MRRLILSDSIFFILPLIGAMAIALYLVFGLQFVYPDALSRSFHAYTVFFGNQPKFANIGFVWPPFPTLMTLPFVLIKPLNVFGLVGNVMSAIFLAITCVYLNKIFRFFSLSSFLRIILILLFIVNPMIMLYGANGMSEIFAISFFVATLYYLLSYLKFKNLLYLIGASVTTSLAVMTRYEMLALIPAIILILLVLRTNFFKKSYKKSLTAIEMELLLFAVPVVFTILMWILANWAIMHNPFYFISSVYSNTSQSSQLLSESDYYRSLSQNIFSSFFYVAQRVIVLFPAFAIFVATILIKVLRKKNWRIAVPMLFFPFSLLLFHALLLYKGESFGWLRFFIYVIPASFVMCSFLLAHYERKRGYILISALLLFSLFVSSVSSFFAMGDKAFGIEEHRVVRAISEQSTQGLSDYSYSKNLEIARYLQTHVTDGKILVDDFTGFPIIYLSGRTDLFVETIDTNFYEVLEGLRHEDDVQYVLVHQPGGLGDLDAINRTYPTLFENGAGFASLVHDFGKWRLYKKISPKT